MNMSPGSRYGSHSHWSISWSQLTGHFVHTWLSSSHSLSSAPCSKFVVDQPDRKCTKSALECTFAPVAPNIVAMALPMPRAPPVTMHTGASTAHTNILQKHCSDLQGHAKTARVYVREEGDRNTCGLCRRLLSLDSSSTNDVKRPCRTRGCLQ